MKAAELADSHLLREHIAVAAVEERGDKRSIGGRLLDKAVGTDTKENVCSLISKFVVVATGMIVGGTEGRDTQIGAS